MKIGVLDSGVGGFSVLYELIPLFRGSAEFIYLADYAGHPYGEKTPSELERSLAALARRFFETYELDILVVACNTATTYGINAIRAAVDCQVVGTVPAIKPAAARSSSKEILVLGTPLTSSGRYVRDLATKFAEGCQVTFAAVPELVQIVELKLSGTPPSEELVWQSIARHMTKNTDTIVLGCTHFPFLRTEICRQFSGKVVTSEQSVAKQTFRIANQSTPVPEQDVLPKIKFLATTPTAFVERADLIDKWQHATRIMS